MVLCTVKERKIRMLSVSVFFFKQKTAYEMLRSLVGSEMCIRDRYYRRYAALEETARLQDRKTMYNVLQAMYYRRCENNWQLSMNN